MPCLRDQLPRAPMLEVKNSELGEETEMLMRLRVPRMCEVKERIGKLKFTCHLLSPFQVSFNQSLF